MPWILLWPWRHAPRGSRQRWLSKVTESRRGTGCWRYQAGPLGHAQVDSGHYGWTSRKPKAWTNYRAQNPLRDTAWWVLTRDPQRRSPLPVYRWEKRCLQEYQGSKWENWFLNWLCQIPEQFFLCNAARLKTRSKYRI